ncbi:MAG: DMT family transporter, partial [Pseudomonas marincola]
MLKVVLLVFLGLLWSVRLSSIKAAGLSGIPIHVVVAIATLGIAAFFTGTAVWRGSWPPVNRSTMFFYVFSGTLGFILPFMLESLVAPSLPVFVFIVIIATMPVITLIISTAVGHETLGVVPVMSVVLGFAGAMAILWDTARITPSGDTSLIWVGIAFGVPTLYALNTVFVAKRWPSGVTAVQVAHAQTLIMSVAVLFGSLIAGTFDAWSDVTLNMPAMGLIIVCEGLALLVYLKIAHDYGATYVSFANYISMIFAALIGVLVFEEQMTWLSMVAAGTIVGAIT